MKRFLFVGPDHPTPVGGREQLSRLHRRALGELLGADLDVFLIPPSKLSGAKRMRAVVTGRMDGITRSAETLVLERIADSDIDCVWLDGSNLGVLARAIKQRYPNVEVLSFFHNIEARFFWGAARQRPTIRAFGVFVASYIAERCCARFSDRLITLNRRDAAELECLYGRAATDILPMALDDAWNPAADLRTITARPLLFVGGSFYANKAGIAWFASKVVPATAVETIIVGRGMERDRAALERTAMVRVVGPVEDLSPYYRDALAVIAPIFDGSGMKTKVAEALMHGKLVIGTREAFTGYDEGPCQVGWRAETPAEWVSAIERAKADPPLSFDPALRRIYEDRYSTPALKREIASILGLNRGAQFGCKLMADGSGAAYGISSRPVGVR